ncbi:amidase [Halomonas cupida]|uniref:amidase n=1 Tax=Halomonas cupida TaxID=44933 RepID=UPI003A8F2416
MTASPIALPLRTQYQQLRNGQLHAVQLVETAMTAWQYRGHHDHAYRTWNGDAAMVQARSVDELLTQGADTGPLMGMAVSIKDIYAVSGLPTFAGSSRRLGQPWERSGPLVRQLSAQLPSIMGKTHTVEFAFGGLGTNAHWGTPRNPWDTAVHRTPGGSSSGAGVSLIGGTASLALGTDTAGSVRIPAAMTGVAGLKTTAGRWPTAGIVPLSSTLDTPGLLARCVDDLAFAFDALDQGLTGLEDRVLSPPPLASLTLGVPDSYFWDDCSPGVAEAVQQAIRQLEAAGVRLVPLDIPRTGEALTLFQEGGLAAAELAEFLNSELPDTVDRLDANVAARVRVADQMPAPEYIRRRRLITALSTDACEALRHVDAVLTPTVAITPPALTSLEPAGAYAKANMTALKNTMIANFMGLCALTLPVGRDAENMPVGLQVMAGPMQESRLLAMGISIEHLLGNGSAILGEPEARVVQ